MDLFCHKYRARSMFVCFFEGGRLQDSRKYRSRWRYRSSKLKQYQLNPLITYDFLKKDGHYRKNLLKLFIIYTFYLTRYHHENEFI